jgi:hypothetical protein
MMLIQVMQVVLVVSELPQQREALIFVIIVR